MAALASLPIVVVLATLAAAGKQALRVPARPVISLDLLSLTTAGLNHTTSNRTSGEICHTKNDYLLMGQELGADSLQAPDSCEPDGTNSYHRSYVKYCRVLLDTAESCPEPKASAWDHHDGNLDVLKTIKLVITSDPQHLPHKTDKFVDALDYNRRSEYALTYDAEDITGNKAERMTFAMVIAGT